MDRLGKVVLLQLEKSVFARPKQAINAADVFGMQEYYEVDSLERCSRIDIDCHIPLGAICFTASVFEAHRLLKQGPLQEVRTTIDEIAVL